MKSILKLICAKNTKNLFIFLLVLTFFTNLFAKESQLAGDAKKALKEYAGYKELINRGFNLNMLDSIETSEDLFKVLEPFMIIDGKPLDNTLSFNGYNFARHKTIHFENTYGTIQELLNKGYEPDQLFYYPSKGKEIYRIGTFIWEKPEAVTYPWTDVCYYNRPFMGKKIAYFFPGSFTQDYFKPYIKEITKKEAIVVDLRLCQGGWNQIYALGEALCLSNYTGKVIFIIDKTTGSDCESNISNNLRKSYYINGKEKKVNFEWITIGENTAGKQTYPYNAKWNYKVGDLQFSPLPVNENKWAVCKEGEGVMPYIWAVGDEDINKTVELLTGEKNFAELIEDVSEWRNYLCSSDKALWNSQFSKLPDVVSKIKSQDEYNKTVSALLKIQIQYNSILDKHRDDLYNVGCWWFELSACPSKAKNPEDYITAYTKYWESRINWISFILEDSKNMNWVWWEEPGFFKSFKSFEQYADYFSRWIELRIWWCKILRENKYVIENNSIRGWSDALKEDVKEWKDPEKHLAEMTNHLKETAEWIEYLQPHPYVIPKDMRMAKLYGSMKRTSDKIGKGCSAVPAEITKLQKSNPKEYVEKMAAYINSVADNDFEKVKLVFDIEQEILTYDHETWQKSLQKIAIAKKGVGEDYKLYKKNLNELSKKAPKDYPDQDWKSVLEKGTCVCNGYAQLMQYFCYRLGIKCDWVGNPEDMIFAEGHAWNIVEINGEHYHLDATWGHSWLFMEPEAFLKGGHFPKEPEQQLLEKTMTLDEYKKLKNYKGNNS